MFALEDDPQLINSFLDSMIPYIPYNGAVRRQIPLNNRYLGSVAPCSPCNGAVRALGCFAMFDCQFDDSVTAPSDQPQAAEQM